MHCAVPVPTPTSRGQKPWPVRQIHHQGKEQDDAKTAARDDESPILMLVKEFIADAVVILLIAWAIADVLRQRKPKL